MQIRFILSVLLFFTFVLYGDEPALMPKANRALLRDLKLLNYPPADWRKDIPSDLSEEALDVAIIGAGMSGLTVGAALYKEGIYRIKLFDNNPCGCEGPWATCARMPTLRSQKELAGPALGIPHLTFHAWFEASFGSDAWKEMGKIPTPLWMDYLKWYREALDLPVENECALVDLIPLEQGFELHFVGQTGKQVVFARKVILATGRLGFGGARIPEFAKELSKNLCAHTSDCIDFRCLKGRSIAVIGAGASGFDAAATALECGAKKVDILMRRNSLPKINKFSSLPFKGFNYGYFKLDDLKKCQLMTEAFSTSTPPSADSLRRVAGAANLTILSNTAIEKVEVNEPTFILYTNKGPLTYDFMVLATGYEVNGDKQRELHRVIRDIELWKDKLPESTVASFPSLGLFPYLGATYEFTPKVLPPDSKHYLSNLYCFNYAAMVSHGPLSSDIPAISVGATRLAQGIAADFFVQEHAWFLENLRSYDHAEFDQNDFQIHFD